MPRFFDIVIACLALAALAPILALIAALIALADGRPIFFRQVRIGRGGVPFTLVKFRSLDNQGTKTPLGTILRRFSLDELPEFWNVVRGDMALVGPRPMILAEQPSKPLTRALRQQQRPGITGWAQIRGRNAVSFDQTYLYDLWYGRNRTLALDVYILLATLPCVVRGHGACALTSDCRTKPTASMSVIRAVGAS